MALIKWPDSLPLPLLRGHGYTPGNKLKEIKMESGASRFRKKSFSGLDVLSASFLMNNDEAAFFEGWFKHAINDGEKWFSMPVKTPLGTSERVARIKTKQKKRAAVGNRLWSIQLSFELKAG